MPQPNSDTLKPNLKYGKPTREELSMTTYTPDTTAAAICLLQQGKTDFVYHDYFKLITERTYRIKILKPQGSDYANVTIPYYAPVNSNNEPDRIDKLSASSYNLENGKTIKTELTEDLISDERVDQYVKLLKFSIPAVKVGTVIEYRYTHISNYLEIPNWYMQKEIPVIYNQYTVTIPHVYVFNIETRGEALFKTEKKAASMRAANYTPGPDRPTCFPSNATSSSSPETTFLPSGKTRSSAGVPTTIKPKSVSTCKDATSREKSTRRSVRNGRT